MRVVIFCHSIESDWNHGNAHFLRGVATELLSRGHEVIFYEPEDAWSVANLVEEHGEAPLEWFKAAYPGITSFRYRLESLDPDEALDGASLVLVHEWNDPALVRKLGERRAAPGGAGFKLLFHDTHHRAITDPCAMSRFDLRHYDGVLAFGEILSSIYLERGWADRVWTWHEAADVRICTGARDVEMDRDLVWIGNWGDEERTAELGMMLISPVMQLGLRARVYGVRYPQAGRAALASAGIEYEGWLPNFRVPDVFARSRATVHIPRRPYVRALRGIPTIRVFEALACGIPLVSAPWDDCEGLFTPGSDYLVAHDSAEMARHLRNVLMDDSLADSLARHGRETILARHTCAHRVDELLKIAEELGAEASTRTLAA